MLPEEMGHRIGVHLSHDVHPSRGFGDEFGRRPHVLRSDTGQSGLELVDDQVSETGPQVLLTGEKLIPGHGELVPLTAHSIQQVAASVYLEIVEILVAQAGDEAVYRCHADFGTATDVLDALQGDVLVDRLEILDDFLFGRGQFGQLVNTPNQFIEHGVKASIVTNITFILLYETFFRK
jgi:hypothetical protein